MRSCDVLVVGAGPAGMAAATAAARCGRSVIVLDDNSGPGGQIWQGGLAPAAHVKDAAKAQALRAFARSGAVLLSGYRVVDAPRTGLLLALATPEDRLEGFAWQRLIVATGARERFLPFPGWTLPGVFGAGGLQALVRSGYPIAGKRVVVAGTGPLLLAVAAHLRQAGAQVVTLAEQASLGQLLPLSAQLARHPSKLWQGAGYRLALGRTRWHTGCWPVAAEGTHQLTAVQLNDGRRRWTEPCDLMACSFHLVPNTELAALLGCRLENGAVAVDARQQTSRENIFCAGEPVGIAGVAAAAIEGEIAGLCAAGEAQQATALFGRRDAERRFGRALAQAFTLRQELRTLAQPDTIVCRCEDVRLGQLQQQSSWTEAKLQTRCGMGPCQARICGPAVETIFGWRNTSIRPPLFPVPLSALCSADTALADTSDLQEHR